ncbi:MAG: transglycosylase domain-containing protein [Cyclobacteriaceae bacterium]|nr:transglycosylase domain-containing protein [Cyclobacteriaceae bacterium]
MNTSSSTRDTIKQKIRSFLFIERSWFNKIVKYFWILFISFCIGFPFYIYSVSINLFGLFGGMPSYVAIENPENDLSSEIISADGVSLGRYFRYNRSQVAFNELSPDLVNTLIYSEDHRFYEHSGMDFIAYLRVIYGVLTLDPKGGGSTITQQLAKNLYTQNPELALDGTLSKLGRYPRRLIQKTKEWIISYHLEKNFTKEEIIAMYLNTAEFGSNSYGIKVAAETYFGKTPDSLNVQESAVLVGMLQAITKFNPVFNPENSLSKRNEVLAKLLKHGYIQSKQDFDSIKALPIALSYKVQNQNEGLATYFRTVIRNDLMKWCEENGYDLWESGLKIYTTIDSRMQRYAEEALTNHMRNLQKDFKNSWNGRDPWMDENFNTIKGFLESRIKQTDAYRNYVAKYGVDSDSVKIMLNVKKPMRIFTWDGERDTLFSSMDSLNYYKRFLQAGFMSMDPHTGEVKAWVGGINHKYFKYDHVKQGTRQPGSTFKPFTYGTAIENGFSPCLKLPDISPSFDLPSGTWRPPNSEGGYGNGEKYTLRQAMARSLNSITAQLIQKVKPENVVDFAKRAGIESPLDAVPSLCLGVSDVSLFELIGAYSTFVNEGIYTQPYYISRIEDKNGNIVEVFTPKTRQAMNEQTAYKMVYMLKGGVEEEGGTSRGLPAELKIENEIGGKTGTTNNASDGWYMGITPNLVSGAWVGGDERSIHYRSWDKGQGSKTARPIWAQYMLKVYGDTTLPYKKGFFKLPSSGMDATLDCDRYEQSDSGNPDESWNPDDSI